MSGAVSQPTTRRLHLRANCKMELMKQQVEQEKLRRRAKPLTASVPFTRQSAALEAARFAECPVKVSIYCHKIMNCLSSLKCFKLLLTHLQTFAVNLHTFAKLFT